MTIRIWSTFSSIILPNTNTLFGLLFRASRIQIEYLVQLPQLLLLEVIGTRIFNTRTLVYVLLDLIPVNYMSFSEVT